MKKAYLFPGQGSQYQGMGRDHYRFNKDFRDLCEQANEILGFRITDIMFEGSEEQLSQTRYTQPALFIHAYSLFVMLKHEPDMVAGHSLGEYTALAASGALKFEDAMKAVKERGELMQKAGEEEPGAMAAVIGLADEKVEEICREISESSESVAAPANYNANGQLVISGHEEAITHAMEKLKEAGAKMVKKLAVSGAFHTRLMSSAKTELDAILDKLEYHPPKAFVYSNVNGTATKSPEEIKTNLKDQLLSPVRWTQTLLSMQKDGALHFIETGPGNVLQGLVKRTLKKVEISGFQ